MSSSHEEVFGIQEYSDVSSDKIVIESAEPMRLAREMLYRRFGCEEGRVGVVGWNQEFWVWTPATRRWEIWSEMAMQQEVMRVFENAEVEVPTKKGSVIERWAPTANKAKDVVAGMAAITSIPKMQSPVWLGKGAADTQHCVAFEDEVLGIRTGARLVRNEKWLDHVVAPVKYNTRAICPTWGRCVEEWGQGDEEWASLLQRWMGYCLMGTRKYGRWMLMPGKIRGGKGTVRNVMKALIGDRGFRGTTMESLAGPFGLDGAEHARVICVNEVSELEGYDGHRVAAIVKNIVGEDPLRVNAKFKREVEVDVPAKVMMLSNEIPRMPNRGSGLSGKMLILPFEVSFVGREQFDLTDRLMGELEGIAAWAVQGAKELEAEEDPRMKWPVPERAEEWHKRYRSQNNGADPFLEAVGIKNPEGFVSFDVLWSEFLGWKRRNDVRMHLSRNKFTDWLMEEGTWDVWKVRHGKEGNRGFMGMSLKMIADE